MTYFSKGSRVHSVLIAIITLFSVIVTSFLPVGRVNAAGNDNEDGLVAHWTFDNNYNESASGMTTQLGAKAITYTDGIYGKAAVFNGKDNYLFVDDDKLNLGNGEDTDNNNFTISAWVNLGDSKTVEKYLVDKGQDTGWGKSENVYWTNPYRVKFEGCEPIVDLSNVYETLEPEYRTEGNSTTRGKHVEGNEWFLLTITYDGSVVKIYRDNSLLTQSNYTDGITFNHDYFYIGVDGRLESYFKGAVDDLRIYTRTLSYDDVAKLYEKGLSANKELVEPTRQMVAYYPFDNNLKDASVFHNDANMVEASGTTQYNVGKNGMAITMKKGSYILVPTADQLNLEDEFTISFWLKLTADGEVPVLYRQNPSYTDTNDDDWTYALTINSWSKGESTSASMKTWAYTSDDWTPVVGQGLDCDFTYGDNKLNSYNWIHYTYTYLNGQMKCYLNGKLQNKSDKSDQINISNASGDLLIGYDGSTFMNGTIDELKIYNSCCNADAVLKEAKRIDSISLGKSDVKKICTMNKGITVNLSSVLLKDGDNYKITSLKTSNKALSYKSSNSKIFKVSSDGKITAIKSGKAKLTITYGGNTAVYTIIVK